MTEPPAAPKRSLKTVWPHLWELVRPRRGLLGLGLALVAVNRVARLVLPASTKVLIDDIVLGHKRHLLLPLVTLTESLLHTKVEKECLLWHGGNWGALYWILNGGFKGRRNMI